MPKKNDNLNIEKSLQELEALVEKMEGGDLSLEDSLKCFERGVTLTRNCQKALAEAEQKVQILLQKEGKETLEDFQPDEDN